MRNSIFLTLVLFGLFLIPLFAQDKINIAVLDLESKAVSKIEASSISDELRSQIIKIERFNMIERSKMNDIIAEQGLQSSDMCNSEECFVEMGQIIGVEKLIVGSIGKVGGIFILSTRMIDVKTGKIMVDISDKFKGTIEDVLLVLVPRVAEKLGEQFGGSGEKKGTISIKCNVEDAEVFLDGTPQGKAPIGKLSVPTGGHTITVTKFGYSTGKSHVVIDPKRGHQEISVTLKPKNKVDALYRSVVPGWGQLYNEQKWKAITVGAVQAATLGAYVGVLVSYNGAVTAYEDAHQVYYNSPYSAALKQDMLDKHEAAEGRKGSVVIMGVVAGAVWVLNIADILLFSPDYQAAPAAEEQPAEKKSGLRYQGLDLASRGNGVNVTAEFSYNQ